MRLVTVSILACMSNTNSHDPVPDQVNAYCNQGPSSLSGGAAKVYRMLGIWDRRDPEGLKAKLKSMSDAELIEWNQELMLIQAGIDMRPTGRLRAIEMKLETLMEWIRVGLHWIVGGVCVIILAAFIVALIGGFISWALTGVY